MESEEIKPCLMIGVSLLVMLILVVVSNEDKKADEYQEQEYCSMVELYQQTNGDAGWPDFKHTYNKSC